ncbi:MAG: hypothetical protein ACK59Y_15605 [Betaproteobacteria bacterium]|nr:hypothetical protein [Betaproteobacteria bacterium]
MALLAFLFGLAIPALAVARHALDPTAFAAVCRVDTGFAQSKTQPGSMQDRLASAHCLMCLGNAAPPDFAPVEPVVVSFVTELLVSFPRSPWAADDPAALQPLNPRAPPRA